jgi:hypothetical protein
LVIEVVGLNRILVDLPARLDVDDNGLVQRQDGKRVHCLLGARRQDQFSLLQCNLAGKVFLHVGVRCLSQNQLITRPFLVERDSYGLSHHHCHLWAVVQSFLIVLKIPALPNASLGSAGLDTQFGKP